MMRNLLSAGEQRPEQPFHHHPTPGPAPTAAKRPQSANGAKKRPISRGKAAPMPQGRDFEQFSKEDLLVEIQDLKKKLLGAEEALAAMRSEAQRMETDGLRQQKRIEQLLHLSEGTRANGGNLRKEIEKSILVRQLKQQVTALRNLVADKDIELDNLRRDTRTSHVKEMEAALDEYQGEIVRLLRLSDDLKEELFREKARREWNSKLANETGEELRRELARLAAGYQHILSNIQQRPSGGAAGAGTGRPSTGNSHKRPSSAAAAASSKKDVFLTSAGTGAGAAGDQDVLDMFNPNLQTLTSAITMPSQQQPQPQQVSQQQQQPQQVERKPAPQTQTLGQTLDLGLGLEQDAMSLVSGVSSHSRERVHVAQEFIPVGYPQQNPIPVPGPAPQAVPVPGHPAQYNISDAIEALYYNGSTWYPGVVRASGWQGTKGCWVYEVQYADGEREKAVLEGNIRYKEGGKEQGKGMAAAAAPAPKTSSPTTPTTPAPAASEPEPEAAPSPPKYTLHARIEGLFDGRWYPGTVTAVTPGYGTLYDVLYDDGDTAQLREEGLRPLIVPVPGPVLAPVPVPGQNPNPGQVVPVPGQNPNPGRYAKGARVQALYSDGSWYNGTVTSVDGGVYGVLYDDGDVLEGADESRIRDLPNPSPGSGTASSTVPGTGTDTVYAAGDRVESYFPIPEAWYSGTVESRNRDGSYIISYDDGDKEVDVRSERMRFERPAAVGASPAVAVAAYAVGDAIEGRYGTGNEWFPGRIAAVRTAGPYATYSIDYEDGDSEQGVKEERIRRRPAATKPVVAASAPAAPVAAAVTATAPVAAHTTGLHPTTTNLDSFLDELSDDEDGGLLDGGRLVTVGGTDGNGDIRRTANDEDYDDDFAA